MAINSNITVTSSVAVQLTNANCSRIRVQNRSSTDAVLLMATATAVAPGSFAGGIALLPGQTLAADLTLADLWPGVAGAARVYAISTGSSVTLSVSHADA